MHFMNVAQTSCPRLNHTTTVRWRRRVRIARIVLAFVVVFAASVPLFGIELTVTVQPQAKDAVKNPLGVGFGHWEGVEPLKITMVAPPKKRITKAEVFASEDVIWWAADPKAPTTFETAAIFPDEAFAALFKGELANEPVAVAKKEAPKKATKKNEKKPPVEPQKPPEWAVGVNDVDLDFDSDNNSVAPGRLPDEAAREDQLEFAEEGPATGPLGMRIAKEEDWVRLRLKGHAKTDGYLSLQATNLTDFEFRDAQQSRLSGIASPKSAGADGATILFEKEFKAGTRIDPLAFDIRVTDAGAAGEGQCMVIGQFQAATKGTDGSGPGHAIDKGLIKVAPDIDFDFTAEMLLDPEAKASSPRHFIYPCVALCEVNHEDGRREPKMFLRYKTGSVANIQSVTFTIKDKEGKIVWQHTDSASADWKEIFPECRANKKDSVDFSGEPYQVGEKWKYLDPGKNGDIPEGTLADHSHYPPQSSAYQAEMTVKFGGGAPDKKLNLDFAVKSRSVLISRESDAKFGMYAEATARHEWKADGGSAKFSKEVNSPEAWLKLRYEATGFTAAYEALTPRGRLFTVNHGASLEHHEGPESVFGNNSFGGVFMGGASPWGEVYGGFSGPSGEHPTTYSVDKPLAELAKLEPYGAFVDFAHCFTAHKSGFDDEGPSIHETLASTINAGIASAAVRGYVGWCNMTHAHWEIRSKIIWKGTRKSTVRLGKAIEISRQAIRNLVAGSAAKLGLIDPLDLEGSAVKYSIKSGWGLTHELSEVPRVLQPVLTFGAIEAEIARILEAEYPNSGATITVTEATAIVLKKEPAGVAEIEGDDEGAPEGIMTGEDGDDDENPSSSKDKPKAKDVPFHLIIVTP
jgi:hypothetical protein